MSAEFKVGDICIGQNHVIDVEYNGMECEVIMPFGLHAWHDLKTGAYGGVEAGYVVQWANGKVHICRPQNLRKKQPPRSAKAIMRAAILKAKQPVEVMA